MAKHLTDRLAALLAAAAICSSACDRQADSLGELAGQGSAEAASSTPLTDLRIYRDPYSAVDWSNDLRLKAQHHDHVARAFALPLISAYDAAGYQVLSLMDYSGKPSVFYSLRERPWPPERWVPQPILAGLRNIKLFVPNAEEVGIDEYHVTSAFLTSYLEVSAAGASPLPGQYATRSDLLRLVRSGGGLPCLAHPWTYSYAEEPGLRCAEIYTAFAEAARFDDMGPWLRNNDGNAALLANWDRALERNQDILGIAVNDHFGPGITSRTVPAQVLDSGKIIVLAKAITLEAYRNAFERGAFFAIRDRGIVKDRYPTVFAVSSTERHASIESSGNVSWITAGTVVARGPVLLYSDIPPNTKYVRAEVAGDDGSVVFTQPFVVRPTGDVDGDYDIDHDDQAVCDSMHDSGGAEPVRVAACSAARLSQVFVGRLAL